MSVISVSSVHQRARTYIMTNASALHPPPHSCCIRVETHSILGKGGGLGLNELALAVSEDSLSLSDPAETLLWREAKPEPPPEVGFRV